MQQRSDEWPFHACCGGKQEFGTGERSQQPFAQTIDVVVPTEIGGQSNTKVGMIEHARYIRIRKA